MKVYKKIILDKNNNVIYEDYYNYDGKWARLGIHYDFKSTKGAKLMEKKAKREKKLLERRLKKQQKSGTKKEEDLNAIPVSETITLEHLTRHNTEKK